MSTAPQFVAYLRVSTTGQEASGLGIEAQREAIAAAVRAKGGVILREFVEIASGGDNERPELLAALAGLLKPGGLLVLGAGEVTNFALPTLSRVPHRQALAFLRNR